MVFLKYLLLPFSLLYGCALWIRRNLWYRYFRGRYQAPRFALSVGNITVGGTGKTPVTKWLEKILGANRNTVVLSRGYGRATTGFFEVLEGKTAKEVGDEPLELRQSASVSTKIVVCENRPEGIRESMKRFPETDLFLLDDAYQHLALHADFYLLLCDYNRPFFKDLPMPGGRLREFAGAAVHSDAILVTKCPEFLSMEEGLKWYAKLGKYGKPIFFCSFQNTVPENVSTDAVLHNDTAVLLVSGLAENAPFVFWAKSNYRVESDLLYPDHFAYNQETAEEVLSALKKHGANAVLTTAKDAVKLRTVLPVDIEIFETATYPVFHFGGEEALIQLLLKKIKEYENL